MKFDEQAFFKDLGRTYAEAKGSADFSGGVGAQIEFCVRAWLQMKDGTRRQIGVYKLEGDFADWQETWKAKSPDSNSGGESA